MGETKESHGFRPPTSLVRDVGASSEDNDDDDDRAEDIEQYLPMAARALDERRTLHFRQ